jgi:glycerol-3-phosphate acyltransferase PlsX
MRIGLDIMGGDFAPDASLEGIKLVHTSLPEHIKLVLIGDENVIHSYMDKNGLPRDRFQVVHASQVIEMGEAPTRAVMQKQDSSIMVGMAMLKGGHIDAFISAGNTGAVYVGALYTVKAVDGIQRPAITSLIPKEKGGYNIILDVGANADCKQDTLYQFGILGSLYSKYVNDVTNPKVGLLNMGSEPEKGNLVVQAAYTLFENSKAFNFIGNVEGYDLFSDKVDVIVCDGFTGNVVLKTAETIYQIMKKRGLTDDYFKRFDYEDYGATPILGLNKPVMIAHGVSTPQAFHKMIHITAHLVESQLIDKIKQAFTLELHGQ